MVNPPIVGEANAIALLELGAPNALWPVSPRAAGRKSNVRSLNVERTVWRAGLVLRQGRNPETPNRPLLIAPSHFVAYSCANNSRRHGYNVSFAFPLLASDFDNAILDGAASEGRAPIHELFGLPTMGEQADHVPFVVELECMNLEHCVPLASILITLGCHFLCVNAYS